jgi:parallel beta-helix repeat protein
MQIKSFVISLLISIALLGLAAAVAVSASSSAEFKQSAAEPMNHTWHYEQYGAANVGQYPSLALSSSDVPHISSCAFGTGPTWTCNALIYATLSGSAWATDTVDSGAGIGAYSSLALDSSGAPHIGYYDGANQDLRYARWDGGGWDLHVVQSSGSVGEYLSLALDSSDDPHISYYDATNRDLRYAYWDGSSWISETVDSAGTVGQHTSLVLNASDQPLISYVGADFSVRVAAYNGSAWNYETVATDATEFRYTSVDLADNGYPYLTFSDDSGELTLAYWTVSGWRSSTVLSRDAYYSSLVMAGSVPHVGYNYINVLLPGGGTVRYGYRSGTSWQLEDVDAGGAPDDKGWHTSLALDSSGQPHLAYFNHDDNSLTYAWGEETCSIPLTDVRLDGPLVVDVGTTISLTSVVTPGNATLPIVYAWYPEPTSGQGTPIASYQVMTEGLHTFDLTASNCGGPVSDIHDILALPAGPYTWTVTTAADDMSLVSLRLALTYARAGDTIVFDQSAFPGGTAINLTEPLPHLDQGNLTVTTSGWTVVIDGTAQGSGPGLVLDSDHNHVRNLELHNMPEYGLLIDGDHNVVGWESGTPCDGRKIAGPEESMALVISGSTDDGILIHGDFNRVSGSEIRDNGGDGIEIYDAADNLIGGDQIGLGNVIGDNTGDGVRIEGAASARNLVYGNLIGSDDNGMLPRGNQAGVRIDGGPSETEVGGNDDCQGNLIVDHDDWGIQVSDAEVGTLILSNIVGVNKIGSALPNSPGGIKVHNTSDLQIGGPHLGPDCDNPCNLISGNSDDGLTLTGAGTHGVEIYGNYMGLDINGEQAVGNGGDGISLLNGANMNQIGEDELGWTNLIGGNGENGILLDGFGVDDNLIVANVIGLNLSMESARGNQNGIKIHQGAQGATIDKNVIAANNDYGVYISGSETANHTLTSNLIGTTPAGLVGLGNAFGIRAENGCPDLLIGGPDPSDGNVIAHNADQGVNIYGTVRTVVQSNSIEANGLGIGVLGASTSELLVAQNDVTDNLGNGIQVQVADDGEIISNTVEANGEAGIEISSAGTSGHLIQGNDVAANEVGIRLLDSSNNNELRHNLVRDNTTHGIYIEVSFENELGENEISGNGTAGVALRVGAHDNQLDSNEIHDNGMSGVGFTEGAHNNQVHENQIYANGSDGVFVFGNTTVENEILCNEIYGNGAQRIQNTWGGNTELEPPRITTLDYQGQGFWNLEGQACANCWVHFFINKADSSASTCQYAVQANANGHFSMLQIFLFVDQFPDLTATDANGNTSEYASESDGVPDLEVTSIEVVQSIQSPRNNVALIAGKQTYVRLHVTSNWQNPIPTTARLQLLRNGQTLGYLDPGPEPDCKPQIGVEQYPDRADLQDSFCFRLEDGMTAAGDLTIEATVNPNQDLPESAYDNNELATTVTFEDSAPLAARVCMVSYPENLYGRGHLEGEYSQCGRLTLADWDKDFLQEVVVGNDDTHELRVFGRVPGSNGLRLETTIPGDATSGYSIASGLAAGDLDGDGHDEVIIIHYEYLWSERYLNVWSWDTTADPPTWTLAIDTYSYDVGSSTYDLLGAGDVDDDGVDEVVILGVGTDELAILNLVGFDDPNPFNSTVVPLAHDAADIEVAELEGGTREEILVLDAENDQVYFYRYGGGSTIYQISALGGGFVPAEAGDIIDLDQLAVGNVDNADNADSPEVIIGSRDKHGIFIYRWTGSAWELATFHDSWFKDVPGVYNTCGSVAAGDVYHQVGKDEVVVGSPDKGRIYVLEKRTSGEWRMLVPDDTYHHEVTSMLERMFPTDEVEYHVVHMTMDKEYGVIRPDKMYIMLTEAQANYALPHEHMTFISIMEGDGEKGGGQAAGVGDRRTHFAVNLGSDGHITNDDTPRHEVGHTRGRGHSYVPRCGPHSRTQRYPYPEATIGDWGREPNFHILDISDPSNPTLVSAMGVDGFYRDVRVQGDWAYVANYQNRENYPGGLRTIDIGDETEPSPYGYQYLGGGPRRLEISGDYAYVADVFGGLYAVDISDPLLLTITDHFELPDITHGQFPVRKTSHMYDLHVQDSHLYAVDYPYELWWRKRWGGQVRIFDLTNPAQLALTDVFTPTRWPNDVYVSGDYIHIATNDGLEIWDRTDLVEPLVDTFSDTVMWSIYVAGNYAYLGTMKDLRVVDVSDPANPALSGTLLLDDRVNDVRVVGNYAYVATRLNGVKIVDISNPASPTLVGEYNPMGVPFVSSGLDVVGDRLYLAAWNTDYYGLDTGDLALGIGPSIKDPYDYFDFMSYSTGYECGPQWISRYQYEAIREELNDSYPLALEAWTAPVVGADMLLVAGVADPVAGTGTLDLTMRSTAGLSPTTLPLSSTVHLVAVDGADNPLADYSLPAKTQFDPESGYEADDVIFDAVIPFPGGTAELRLMVNGSLVATRTVSANPPQVTLDSPNGGTLPPEAVISWTASDPDGDPLSYSIYHSADLGASWSLLTTGWQRTSYTLTTSTLPGSTQTIFRVLASDGVNTAHDDSNGTVVVPYQPPEVRIGAPVDGTALSSDQTVLLAAWAWDPDFQPIADNGFSWSSDRDGALGIGKEIIVDSLSPGKHQITVQVTDANGDTGSASVQVCVDCHHLYMPLVISADVKACVDCNYVYMPLMIR